MPLRAEWNHGPAVENDKMFHRINMYIDMQVWVMVRKGLSEASYSWLSKPAEVNAA